MIFRLLNESVVQKTKILAALVLMLLFCQKGHSQDAALISSRLTLVYGSSIPFNFNTMEKIRNGIEILTGTILGISLVDGNPDGQKMLTGFNIYFKTFNDQANIRGDAYTLPLNLIRVKADNAPGLGTGTTEGYQDLATGETLLFSYVNPTWVDLNWADYQLIVSYECGKPTSDGGNGSLLGEEPDNYNVEIEFDLWPTVSGFQPLDPLPRP